MYKRIIGIVLLVACMVLPLRAQVQESAKESDAKPADIKESLFSWSASALVTSNYIWRGLYVGGPSVQLDATVSYAGVFANVWWNIGASDWTFRSLNPEVDVAIGFSRWGLSVYYLHCFYFDRYTDGGMSRFFDFRNNKQGGTTGEWRVIYNRPVYTNKRGWTTSVNGLCAVRTFSRDGYYVEAKGEEASMLEGEKVWKRAYSTYIEVMAVHNDRNTPVRYRFYVGKNNKDNYDVEPNYLYDIDLLFNSMGVAEDNRVEDLSEVVLGDANSYMIQPIKDVGIKYTVPIKSRINTFWESTEGKVSDNWSRYIIDGSNEWIAEVIWQDIDAQVIRFCLEDGTLADTYSGGAGDVFSIVPTDAAFGRPCNVVIGVRSAKDDWNAFTDGYMWSWHIWMTDKPEEHIYSNGAGTMMDRNLGAVSSIPGDVGALGLLYQWGRKDPFLGASSISENISAVSTGEWYVKELVTDSDIGNIQYATQHPTTYIYGSGDYDYDWHYPVDLTLWREEKTVNDPCPPGWRVPDASQTGVWCRAGIPSGRKLDYFDDINKGVRLPSEFCGKPAWYPATGYRFNNNGTLHYVGENGTYRSVTTTSSFSYTLHFNDDGILWPDSNGYHYSTGCMAVRCYKEGSSAPLPSTPPENAPGFIEYEDELE